MKRIKEKIGFVSRNQFHDKEPSASKSRYIVSFQISAHSQQEYLT